MMGMRSRFRIGRVRSSKPDYVECDQALCLPLQSLGQDGLSLSGGVYSRDGEYIRASGLINNKHTVLGPGEKRLPLSNQRLMGRSLYLGLCHYHYGHFLIETLSRLWPFTREELAGFDHILLLPLNGQVSEFARELFRLLGLEERLVLVTEPLLLDSISIPAPAIEYPGNVHQVITNVAELFAPFSTEASSEQPLYISRTGLTPGHHRIVVGETWIEEALVAQGVRIFKPEQHTVLEQIQAIQRHRLLIGFAGSALHSLILAGGGHQVHAYSARSVPAVFPLLDLALGNQGHYIRAKRTLPGQARIATGFRPEIVDPRPVLEQLRVSGVIGKYELVGYGSAEIDAREVTRYNTALILRRILEDSQQQSMAACREQFYQFSSHHPLDSELMAKARSSSELLRQFIPE